MTMPGTVRTEAHADPVLDSDGRVTERVIIDGGPYAEPLIHRTHRMATGTSTARHDEAHDELLYVMDGAAVVHVSSPAGDDSFHVAAGGVAEGIFPVCQRGGARVS